MQKDKSNSKEESDQPDCTRPEAPFTATPERLQLILKAVHAGSWEWDAATNTTFWSEEVWQLFGYEPFSCKPSYEAWLQTVLPQERADIERTVWHAVDKGREFSVTWRCYGQKGERWLMARAIPLQGHDGSVSCYTGILLDISERKRAERALSESEERFRKLFEQHAAIKILIDPDTGAIIDANQAASDFYGWTIEELRQMRIQQINQLSLADVKSNMEKCCASEQNRFLFRHQRADGSLRDVEVFSNQIEISGKIFLYSIIHDVTERCRLEAITAFRLRLLEMAETHSEDELLQLTLDEARRLTGSAVGFVHFVEHDQLSLAMQLWSTNSIKPEDKGGRYPLHQAGIWADVVRQQKAVIQNNYHPVKHLWEMVDGHAEVKRELVVPLIRAKAVMAIVGVGNKPSFYNDDDIRMVSALIDVAWDIVAKKHAVEQQEKLQLQLQRAQKMELVGQLAGGIAHDFNNMLGVIRGNVELAIDQKPLLPSLKKNLSEILAATLRSADLTTQLLAFARKQEVITKVVDLKMIIEGMLGMLRRLIGENITLFWIPCAGSAQVNIDPSQIDQILINICVNARDAIAGIGTIQVEIDRIHLSKAEGAKHTALGAGDYITLTVTDNGQGIEKKDLLHIFEPFFTTKEAGKGTGLGLSTVYGIVKHSQGSIECQSEPGKGTQFKIYLPAYREHPTTELREPEVDRPIEHGQETILLVEDEQDILKLSKLMLENKGYEVLAASSPSEAIRIATEYKGAVHLLLTDVVMPEMNGRDLSKQLLQVWPNLKILFMSGYTADVIALHGVLDGSVNFIQKPFSFNVLAKTVHKLLKTPELMS